MRLKLHWPLVRRSVFEKCASENRLLRDALNEANKQIRKHRMLLAGIAEGHENVNAALEKVLAGRSK